MSITREERQLLEEKYSGAESAAFAADQARLAAGDPLAYVIGSQPFLGLTIFLDSKPLIPRPETEWWVEQLAARILSISQSRAPRILDLCAGSGVVGCALLKLVPGAHVSFGEIDPAHEATIRKNIRENGLDESRADIRIGDLFAPFAGERFDFIAANPPYASTGCPLPPSVAEYEPMLAIQAGEDGLEVMRPLAAQLAAHLARGAEAWIEFDSDKPDETQALFAAQGFAARVEEDQYGRPRLLVVSSPR